MSIKNAALTACLLAVAAIPLANAFPHTAPIGNHHDWVVEDFNATATTIVVLEVAMKQNNITKLQSVLSLISDPQSLYYGQWLSIDDIGLLVSPSPDAVDAVTSYFTDVLQGQATFDWTYNKEFVLVSAPAGVINSAYGVQYQVYKHSGSSARRFRTKDHVQPGAFGPIADLIDIVVGINDFISLPFLEDPPMKRHYNQTAPLFGEPVATESAAVVLGQTLFCRDGTIAKGTPLCSASPPEIISATATFYPAFASPGNSFTPVSLTFTPEAFTTAIATALPQFSIANISGYATYADMTTSDIGYSTFPVALSPLITPTLLRKQYGVPVGHRATAAAGSIAVIEFIGQYVDFTDLTGFFALSQVPPAYPTLIGYNNPDHPGAESMLDIEFVIGVAQGVPSAVIQINDPWGPFAGPPVYGIPAGTGGWILEYGVTVSNLTNAPLVHSISYGIPEVSMYEAFGGDWTYLDASERELLKMAARGISVFVSSGDEGSSAVGNGGQYCGPMIPEWPTSSPYVTSVGANYLTTHSGLHMSVPVGAANGGGAMSGVPVPVLGEAVCGTDNGIFFTSGGGFRNRSDVYPVQSWQASHVASFLSASDADGTLPYEEQFNRNGRAYPDISALGHNYLTYFGNLLFPNANVFEYLGLPVHGVVVTPGVALLPPVPTAFPIDGTSASAPTVAAIMALVNDALLLAGLPQLGFVNPFLYYAATMDTATFTDVLAGNIKGGTYQAVGSGVPVTCPTGYDARSGWDPASGLGTPNYPALVNAALTLGQSAVDRRSAAGNPDIRKIMLAEGDLPAYTATGATPAPVAPGPGVVTNTPVVTSEPAPATAAPAPAAPTTASTATAAPGANVVKSAASSTATASFVAVLATAVIAAIVA